jgi:hypothetical protein
VLAARNEQRELGLVALEEARDELGPGGLELARPDGAGAAGAQLARELLAPPAEPSGEEEARTARGGLARSADACASGARLPDRCAAQASNPSTSATSTGPGPMKAATSGQTSDADGRPASIAPVTPNSRTMRALAAGSPSAPSPWLANGSQKRSRSSQAPVRRSRRRAWIRKTPSIVVSGPVAHSVQKTGAWSATWLQDGGAVSRRRTMGFTITTHPLAVRAPRRRDFPLGDR